jgi:hypothetical protein
MEHSNNKRNHRSGGGYKKKIILKLVVHTVQQKDDTPMGSPISSILSEIFLQDLESKFYSNVVENRHT